MNPRRKWLVQSCIFWGIPAFLFWTLIGSVWRVVAEREIRSRLATARDRLDQAILEVTPERRLTRRMAQEKEALQNWALHPGDPARFLRERLAGFPPQAVEFSLFDDGGRLLATTGKTSTPRQLEDLFAYLTAPWNRWPPKTPPIREYFSPPFRHPQDELPLVRGRPDLVCTFPESRPGFPWAAWYSQAGGIPAAGERGPGLLALFHLDRFPPDAFLEDFLLAWRDPAIQLGFQGRSGGPRLTDGLASATVGRLSSSLAGQPTGQVHLGPWLAVTRSAFGGSLVAVAPAPTPPWGWLWCMAGGYLLVSLPVLVGLFRIEVLGHSFRFPLAGKLIGLLGLGIFFPLLVSGAVVWLYGQERWEEVLAANRREALERLEAEDRGLERAVRDRELLLQGLCGHLASAPLSPADLMARLETLQDQLMVGEYHLLSSQTAILGGRIHRFRWGSSRLRRLEPPERDRQIRYLIRHGWGPGEDDLWILRFPATSTTDPELYEPGRKKEHLPKLFMPVAREVMNALNSRRGFPIAPAPGGAQLAMAGMVEQDYGQLLRSIKTSLGRIMVTPQAAGRNEFMFTQILVGHGGGPDAPAAGSGGRGPAAGFLLVTFPMEMFTVPYLERNCSLPGPETPHRLLALARGGSRLPSLPSLEVGDALHGILEKAWGQPATPLSLPFSLNGLTCDLTARISPSFPDYVLVDATPHACLVRELLGSLTRGAWVAALVGCFCAVLTWSGLQRFLEPVGQLQRGITAMQARDFTVRLPEEGRDELALLYRAFNRAMVHLADMELAAAVQARILPQGELRAGPFRLASYHRMTQATGGDFFDYFLLPDGRVLMAMGDVTGHGIGSALVTAMAKTGIGILGPALPDRPEEVLQRLGALLLELLQRKRAMTCLLGILDPVTGSIRLANAGHCFPIVVIPGKSPTMVRAVSYPLGVSKRPKVGTSDFSFGPGVPAGSFLVFYTDGLVEAINDQGQQVGFDRFMEFVSAAVREAPDAPGPVLYERVRGFTGSVPWPDDASVVFLQKRETMGDSPV